MKLQLWLQIKCEDVGTGDMFTFDLNDWVAVDEKSDGWREIPVHWPALPQPKGNVSGSLWLKSRNLSAASNYAYDEGIVSLTVLKYQVITYLGDVHQPGTGANVFVCLYGSLGSSGKRLLKHSLTNKDRFTQDQVSQVLSLQEITLNEDVCKRL